MWVAETHAPLETLAVRYFVVVGVLAGVAAAILFGSLFLLDAVRLSCVVRASVEVVPVTFD
jgi:hypothetical protein